MTDQEPQAVSPEDNKEHLAEKAINDDELLGIAGGGDFGNLVKQVKQVFK